MPPANNDNTLGEPGATLNSALNWDVWAREAENKAGVLTQFRNGTAQPPVGLGAFAGRFRIRQGWRNLKAFIKSSLGSDPAQWLIQEAALDVPAVNAAELYNSLRDQGGVNVLNKD